MSNSSTITLDDSESEYVHLTLVPGVRVLFKDVMASDFVLVYAGVHFHVNRYSLMKLSYPHTFSPRMTVNNTNTDGTLPIEELADMDYQSIVADGSRSKGTDSAAHVGEVDPMRGSHFAVRAATRATAFDFLLFLATCFWHDEPAVRFFHRSELKVKLPLAKQGSGAGGSLTPTEYEVSESTFRKLPHDVPPERALHSSYHDYWYAGLAFAHKHHCQPLLQDVYRKVASRRRTASQPLWYSAAHVVVWLWLSETYPISEWTGVLDVTALRHELTKSSATLESISKLPKSLVSIETLQYLLIHYQERERRPR